MNPRHFYYSPTQYVTKNSMFLICCWQHMIKTGVRWHWLGKLYASVIRVFVQQCSFLISTFLQFSSICLGEENKKHNTFPPKQNEFWRFVNIFGNGTEKRTKSEIIWSRSFQDLCIFFLLSRFSLIVFIQILLRSRIHNIRK